METKLSRHDVLTFDLKVDLQHQSNENPKEPIQTINTKKAEYIKAAKELPTEKWNHNLESNTASEMIVQITQDIINTLKEGWCQV